MLQELLPSNQQFAHMSQLFAKLFDNIMKEFKNPSMPTIPYELLKQMQELNQKFQITSQNILHL